jgi:hypothetical protein
VVWHLSARILSSHGKALVPSLNPDPSTTNQMPNTVTRNFWKGVITTIYNNSSITTSNRQERFIR